MYIKIFHLPTLHFAPTCLQLQIATVMINTLFIFIYKHTYLSTHAAADIHWPLKPQTIKPPSSYPPLPGSTQTKPIQERTKAAGGDKLSVQSTRVVECKKSKNSKNKQQQQYSKKQQTQNTFCIIDASIQVHQNRVDDKAGGQLRTSE